MSNLTGAITASTDDSGAVTTGKARLQWSSRMAFILAAAGSAVGLGNIWKFPYITGENGGGAFVLVYLACILLIGIPVMMAEIMIGRRAQKNPAEAMETLAREAKANPIWRSVGWMGVICGFLILSFYTVIAGWAVSYIFTAGSGAFVDITPDQAGAMFGGMLADPIRLLSWSTLVVIVTMYIVGRGVNAGLEKAVNFLMPGLLVLILIMVGYAMSTGHFIEGVEFLFAPDFSKLTTESVLVALGHAFFTLSLASGAIMTYGSYLPKNTSIVKTSMAVAVVDTAVALLAGMAIFPIVFAYGLEPGAGPGLIFVTLPIAFGQMPFGTMFGSLFFIMLSIAAITSAISLIEPAVSWLTEKRQFSRLKACITSGLSLWLLGIGTVLSFNVWENSKLFGKTFFDLIDFLTANLMMPLGGLCIAIFAAWVIKPKVAEEELGLGAGLLFKMWQFAMRYLTPIGIVIVFLNALGVINL
ncbi:sodium-dependent transporter [Neptunomonas sp.]|uniref:sodium-dependent transporter n=1 Tax=Neptunomonas sp. TaxID=1971898 RepID=UPI0025D2D747|nr:sodium-dependent transporter [Neptunomonas sp.]